MKANQTDSLTNITSEMRKILGSFEQYLSVKLSEGDDYSVDTSSFKFKV